MAPPMDPPIFAGSDCYRYTTNKRTVKEKQPRKSSLSPQSTRRGDIPPNHDQRTADSQAGISTRNTHYTPQQLDGSYVAYLVLQ